MTITEPFELSDRDLTLPGRPPARVPFRPEPSHRLARHRPGRPPRRWAPDVFLALVGTGFGAVLGAVITGETRGSLAAPGGLLIAGGRLAGFVGAYLMLIMLVLIARVAWLERAVGQDRLVRWHRRTAPWALGLIAAHVMLITLGYAQSSRTGLLRQMWVFLILLPRHARRCGRFGLLVMVAVTSVRIARRRLKYETWWVVHLYTYLALSLAFAHQIATGVASSATPWPGPYGRRLGHRLRGSSSVYRVAVPIARNLRHQLRVEWAREEAPGVYSVICRGRRIDRLAVSGGQFFQWRFLTRDLWWQAHPYSLSALPRPPMAASDG